MRYQQIINELKTSREELEESEYDRYIQDQEKLLDDLRNETETWINERLDNMDLLMQGVINTTNIKADEIKETLHTVVTDVGATLSTAMNGIWSTDGTFTSVVTGYGTSFATALTTTNSVLNDIRNFVSAMVNTSDKKAETEKPTPPKVETPKVEESKNETPSTPPVSTPTVVEKTIAVGSKINASGAPIYDYAGDKSGERQYFSNDPIYTVLSEKDGYLLARWHKHTSGAAGWFKKSDVKAYKTGGLIDYDGIAAVHGGKKPELVLNSKDTENFIALKDVLQKVDSKDLLLSKEMISSLQSTMNTIKPMIDSPILHNAQSVLSRANSDISIQIGDIQMYGVNDPKAFAAQLKQTLQNDRNIKNIIQADTIGIMTGRNGLNKFKY